MTTRPRSGRRLIALTTAGLLVGCAGGASELPAPARLPPSASRGSGIDPGAGPSGAGTLLAYGAITGHTPLAGGSGAPPSGPSRDERNRDNQTEPQMQRESERGDALESQIEEELRRQETLLREIDTEEGASEAAAPKSQAEVPSLSERADPRAAPAAPVDRDLPMAIFDKKKIRVPKGAWGDNERELQVVQRSLDADRDGKPEQIRFYDEHSGQLLRKEQDRDYDGAIDTWQHYENGALVARELDTNGDSRPDVWERYRNGRMTSREVDRDHDGVRDAFYSYDGDSLVEERHDADNDGAMDLVVQYRGRLRVRVEEDRDHDGRMDRWTTYQPVDGKEQVVHIERDSDGSGKPDVFEDYTMIDGKSVLARRDEDKNGDGTIDITSIYENGKLVRREISDPTLVPL
jgi:hypothetical protein